MAELMVIKDGVVLNGKTRANTLEAVKKEDEKKIKYFHEDEAAAKKDEEDKKKSKKNMGGAMQKTYGMREGGFTKRGGMYKKGY